MSKEQQPLFSCVNCREDYSWPESDLRVYEGELWCQICFDESDMVWRDSLLIWSDLPPFVPEFKKRIADLEAELAEAQKGSEMLVYDVLTAQTELDAVNAHIDSLCQSKNIDTTLPRVMKLELIAATETAVIKTSQAALAR